MSIYGLLYSFTPRPTRIDLSVHWLPCVDAGGWHASETGGRWTGQSASLAVDQTDTFRRVDNAMSNCCEQPRTLEIEYGGATTSVDFKAGERKVVSLPADAKSPKITFQCETFCPSETSASSDTRALGIFVHTIVYVS